MKTIDCLTLKKRLDAESIRIVDVRSASEFASGHIPTAMNIPDDEVLGRLADIGSPDSLLFVCQSGMRSEIVCRKLSDRYPEAVMLDGGTDTWIAAGQPVVKTSTASWSLERQVRLTVGTIVIIASILALTVSPLWAALCLFMAAGMVFAAVSNICLMAMGFKYLPWNNAAPAPQGGPSDMASVPEPQ